MSGVPPRSFGSRAADPAHRSFGIREADPTSRSFGIRADDPASRSFGSLAAHPATFTDPSASPAHGTDAPSAVVHNPFSNASLYDPTSTPATGYSYFLAHHPAPPTTAATAYSPSVYDPNAMTLYNNNHYHQPTDPNAPYVHPAAHAAAYHYSEAFVETLAQATGGPFREEELDSLSADVVGRKLYKIAANPDSFLAHADILASHDNNNNNMGPFWEFMFEAETMAREANARQVGLENQAMLDIQQALGQCRASIRKYKVAKKAKENLTIFQQHIDKIQQATDPNPVVPIEQLTVEHVQNFKFTSRSSAASIKQKLGVQDITALFQLGNVPRAREVTHALSEKLLHFSYGPDAQKCYEILHTQGVLEDHPKRIHLDTIMPAQGNLWEIAFVTMPNLVIELSKMYGVKLRNPSRLNNGNPFKANESKDAFYFYADTLGIERPATV